MNTGIYEILNTVNGKWYRGQVQADYGFEGRFKQHRAILNRGACENKHLQGAWNKYGEDAFTFRVLSTCSPEFCNDLEEYWIGEDYNDRNVSYNKQAGGNNGRSSEETNRKKSEVAKIVSNRPEVRRMRSKAMKKKWADPTFKEKVSKKISRANGQPFICRWPDGRITRYLSTPEAAADLGVGRVTIQNYLKGIYAPGKYKRTAHLKGCVFEYITQ